jgi:hypothetical protein
MTDSHRIHWGLIAAAAVMAELSVIAVFFVLLFGAMLAGVPEIARPLTPLDYADALVSSFLMVLFFTLWLAKRIDSRFVLHGILVGALATLLFVVLNLAITGSFEEPLLYWVAHGLKLLGGMTGGMMAGRRQRQRVVLES